MHLQVTFHFYHFNNVYGSEKKNSFLLKENGMTKQVFAKTEQNESFVFLIVLDVQAFERLLGPCMDLMKRGIDDYESQLVQIFGDKANISDLR